MVFPLGGFDPWTGSAVGVSGLSEEVCMANQSMIGDH
jgi:hypothetical protein